MLSCKCNYYGQYDVDASWIIFTGRGWPIISLKYYHFFIILWYLIPISVFSSSSTCMKRKGIIQTYPQGWAEYPGPHFAIFCWPPQSSAALEKRDYGRNAQMLEKKWLLLIHRPTKIITPFEYTIPFMSLINWHYERKLLKNWYLHR